MADKLIYSTGNKLIYGVGNKLVFSDIVMPTMHVTVSFTGEQIDGITSVLGYNPNNFSGTYYNGTSSRVASTFAVGGTAFSRNKSTLLDFKSANYHGGWAWNGSSWTYYYLAWDWTGGLVLPYNGVTINVTFTVEDKSVSDSLFLVQHNYTDALVPGDTVVLGASWTPATHTLLKL